MKLATRPLQEFGHHLHGGGVNHPWLWLLAFLAVAAAIGVLIWALVRGSRPTHYGTPPGLPGDPAIETLRMRFARGEIDADEFGARAAQLSGLVPPAPQPPPVPPPV